MEDEYYTKMSTIQHVICECGWGKAGRSNVDSFVDHVRGRHSIDVKIGNIHFAHCNDCPRRNDHSLVSHLLTCHGLRAELVDLDTPASVIAELVEEISTRF